MRSFFLIAALSSSVFSQWSINPPGGSIRARDSMRVDSLRNSPGIGTDANGKFIKSDSTRVSKYSHRGITQTGSSADTALIARRASDSTWRTLTRIQARAAVGAVDSTRIFCDTPFVPYSTQSGTSKSYSKSPMMVRGGYGGYVDIPSTDTTFTAFGATDDYYSAMATDTLGNIYAVASTYGRVYRQTGGTGAFANIGVTARSYTSICVQRSTNRIFSSVITNIAGWTRIYEFNGSDFIPYDSLSVGSSSYGSYITVSSANDMYFTAQNVVYKKTNMTGSFAAVGTSFGLNPRLASHKDTVYAFAFGGGVYRLIPGASAFSLYEDSDRYHQNSWVDDDGNVYVGVSAGGATVAGVFMKQAGLSVFSLLWNSATLSVNGGTYYNGTLYACTDQSTGDIFTLSSSNLFLRNKLNVGGVSHFRGDVFVYSADSSGSDSILTVAGNGVVGSRTVSSLVPAHNVEPLHVAVGKDATHWKSTLMTYDTTFGYFSIPRYLLFDSSSIQDIYINTSDGFDDKLLTISPSGQGADASRGAWSVMTGNEHTLNGDWWFGTGEEGSFDFFTAVGSFFIWGGLGSANRVSIKPRPAGGSFIGSDSSHLYLYGSGNKLASIIIGDSTDIQGTLDISGSATAQAKLKIDGMYHISTHSELTSLISSLAADTLHQHRVSIDTTITISAPTTIPKHFTVCMNGGSFNCTTPTDTVKILAKFVAPLVTVFGDGVFCFGRTSVSTVYPCWWTGGYASAANTDHTHAIQSAINSVAWFPYNPTTSDYDVYAEVKLLTGTYMVSQIHMMPNVVLSGTSQQQTWLKMIAGTNDDMIIFHTNVYATSPWINGAIIEKMTLDGNKEQNTVYGCGIRTQEWADTTVFLRLSNETYIRNILCYNFKTDGIRIDKLALPFFVQNCFFMDNGRYGISYKPSSGISQISHFLNVSCDGNDSGGIFIDNTSGDGGEIYQFTSCKFEHTLLDRSSAYNAVTNPDRQRFSIVVRNGNGASVLINGVSTHDGMRALGNVPATAQVLLKGTSRPSMVTWNNLRCTMPNDTTPVLIDSVGESVVIVPNSAINGSYNGGTFSTKSIYGMYGNQDLMIGDTTGVRPIVGYGPMISSSGLAPVQIKKLQGFNDNTKNIGTYVDKFTHSSDTETVAASTTIDTLGVHRSGIELRWRHGAGAYLWNNYFTKAKFGGHVEVERDLSIKNFPLASAATYACVKWGDSIAAMSMQNLYSSMGLLDSVVTSKVRIGSGGTNIVNMHYRDSTFVIMLSATDSVCLRRVLP